MSLRDKQIASLKKVLDLNDTADASDEDASGGLQGSSGSVLHPDKELIWKVLVFDDLGMQIISSVLRVSDLRTMVCARLDSRKLLYLRMLTRATARASRCTCTSRRHAMPSQMSP